MILNDYTEVEALIMSIAERAKEFVPQQMVQNYVYYLFKKKARWVPCYKTIEYPLIPNMPAQGKWVGRHSTLPDAGHTNAALAAFDNRYLAVPITTNMIDMWENDGNPNDMAKEAEYQAMFAAVGIRRLLSNAFFNATGGVSPTGLTGLMLEKNAVGAQTSVIGNVPKATKLWWNNGYVELTQDFGTIAPGTTIPAGILAATQILDTATIGQVPPSDLLTTRDIFFMFRRAMLEMFTGYHLVSNETDVAYGFKTLQFDGVTLGWDPQCPADTIVAVHLGYDKTDKRRSGDNTTKLDGDIEDASVDNLLDMDGSVFGIYNPNVRMRELQPRTPYRELNETRWLVDSMNLGVKRMYDQVIAGSDNNSRWSTW